VKDPTRQPVRWAGLRAVQASCRRFAVQPVRATFEDERPRSKTSSREGTNYKHVERLKMRWLSAKADFVKYHGGADADADADADAAGAAALLRLNPLFKVRVRVICTD